MTGYNTSHSFAAASNRVTTTGFSYDTSGNQTNTNAGVTFAYNQENFLTTAGASVSYVYDAQNRRVKKTVSGTTTDYFYLGGVVVSEKQSSTWTDYVFFGGQRVVKQTGATASTASYSHTDHLGSTRVCTDSSGNPIANCYYEPFGELQAGTSCPATVTYRFAGMEFDSETGLYHTWFRQYDTSQGRWLSVDPLAGSADSPQSLNRYSYVWNDPVNFTDPLGLEGEEGPPAFGPGPIPPGDCVEVILDGIHAGWFCPRGPRRPRDPSGPDRPGGGVPNRGDKTPTQEKIATVVNTALKEENLPDCLNEFFGPGTILTNENLPYLNVSRNLLGMGEMRPSEVPATGRGTVYIDRGTFRSLPGADHHLVSTYLHETANVLAVQRFTKELDPNRRPRLGPRGGPPTEGQRGSFDKDIGKQFEKCIFGKK